MGAGTRHSSPKGSPASGMPQATPATQRPQMPQLHRQPKQSRRTSPESGCPARTRTWKGRPKFCSVAITPPGTDEATNCPTSLPGKGKLILYNAQRGFVNEKLQQNHRQHAADYPEARISPLLHTRIARPEKSETR